MPHRVCCNSRHHGFDSDPQSRGQLWWTWYVRLLTAPLRSILISPIVPQNYSDAGSPSPQHAYVRRPNRAYTASVFAKHSRDQRRQSLRETSTQDRTGLHAEYGPIGASSSRHSNTMSEHVGDPVHFNGRSSDNAEGYGSSASWSDAQGHRGRSHSTPEHPGVSNVSAGFASSPGVQAFLAGTTYLSTSSPTNIPLTHHPRAVQHPHHH
jgi:hypothetical protein